MCKYLYSLFVVLLFANLSFCQINIDNLNKVEIGDGSETNRLTVKGKSTFNSSIFTTFAGTQNVTLGWNAGGYEGNTSLSQVYQSTDGLDAKKSLTLTYMDIDFNPSEKYTLVVTGVSTACPIVLQNARMNVIAL